jgi:hypothetical protein
VRRASGLKAVATLFAVRHDIARSYGRLRSEEQKRRSGTVRDSGRDAMITQPDTVHRCDGN